MGADSYEQNVQEAFAQAAKDIHSKFSSSEGDDSTIGRNARSRARKGRTSGTVAIDGAGGADGSEGQGADGQYVDRSTACCVIA